MLRPLLFAWFIINLIILKSIFAAQSFTPISIRVPLRGVFISNDNNMNTSGFRDCTPSANDDCMIDVVDPKKLQEAFNVTSSIKPGTYKYLTVQTCKMEGTYQAKVKGIVTLNNVTYYTSSGDDPLSTNESDLDYVTLTYSGCQRNYDLPQEVTVSNGGTLDVSLFIPVKNIAWADLGPNPIPSGCKHNQANTMSVCMAYPDVTPYVGDITPRLESYSIYNPMNAPDTASGNILLMFDYNDQIIGGTTRRLYLPTSLNDFNFDTPLRIMNKNEDGSYHIENFGGSGSTSGSIFYNFIRANHTGQFYDSFGTAFDYGASIEN